MKKLNKKEIIRLFKIEEKAKNEFKGYSNLDIVELIKNENEKNEYIKLYDRFLLYN